MSERYQKKKGMNAFLLSIKPEYAEKIFAGIKTYEYRRKIFKGGAFFSMSIPVVATAGSKEEDEE